MQVPPNLPKRFFPAYATITQLEYYDKYLAAYIFGSVARGESTEHSDLDVQTKFAYWSAIIDHILAPLGGRQPIAENNCDCEVCRQDLAMLVSSRNILMEDSNGLFYS